jgi:ribose transport system permease protein
MIIIGIFLSIRSDYFLTFNNIVNIFLFISIEGVIVIGMAFLIILGDIDLSVGSNMALSGVLAILMQRYGVLSGVLTAIAGGAIIGLINGLLVTKLRLTSIATTLGMMVMLNGVVFALTKSESVKGTNPAFTLIAQSTLLKIPVPVISLIALVVIFELILKRTYFGRNVFAVGGNITASRFFGIKVERVRITCFVITGFLAGVAGVILASKINVASGRLGINTALLVITAVLLGGISLSGGEGSILKAFQGILLIGILNNAMVLLRISPFIQDMIRGLLLIAMIVIDAIHIRHTKYL